MKLKKIIIYIITIILLIGMIGIIIQTLIEKSTEQIDYDFSKEDEDDVFFTIDEELDLEKDLYSPDHIETISQNEKDEIYSLAIYDKNYIFKKPELYGKELKINSDEGYSKDDYECTKCTIRITDSLITKINIEKLYDDNNQMEILDMNYNPKTEFENSESFLLRCPDDVDLSDIRYKITIEFENDNKKYKVCKTIRVPVSDPSVGRIEATFYEPGTKNILKNGKVKLAKILEKQNITSDIIASETGTSGKVNFTNIPIGKYKLIKILENGQREEKIIEVKKATTTTVEF